MPTEPAPDTEEEGLETDRSVFSSPRGRYEVARGAPPLAASRGVEKASAVADRRPPNPQRRMAEWGPKLGSEMSGSAGRQWCFIGCVDSGLSIGADGSGLEAPVLALQAVNIPHKHVFTCDVNPKIP